ncbi:hypothetical protein V3N99_13640 [Dermatophilaceae bacterium Soc4.6]
MTSTPATAVRPPPPGGALLAVTGASGGLGASVVTAALAVRAVAVGRGTVAVDLDPLGGGLDIVLGLEQTPGTRWSDLGALDGEADGEAVLPTLPRADGVRVLSYGRHGEPVPPQVVGALLRALVAVCDLVVLDLPRADRMPGGAPPLDLHLVLAGTSLTQVAALSAVLGMLSRPDGTGVLLRARSASDPEAGALVPVVQAQLGAPVWGIVPDDRSVPADLTHGFAPGRRPGPFVRALDPVLARVLAHVPAHHPRPAPA